MKRGYGCLSEVQVCPTNRGCAYTIRIIVNGRKFNMGTGTYGMTLEQAMEEGRLIADKLSLDLVCRQVEKKGKQSITVKYTWND